MIRNILIIEDKKSHMDALCKILSGLSSKIEVFTAAGEKEAYQISMECHIHLFLVDIVLNPGNPSDVAGLRFAQEIREVKKYMFTPLIFITSLEDPKLYSYSRLHCYGYIEKPFDEKEVKKLISRALEFPVEDDEERFAYFKKDSIIYAKCIKEIIYVEVVRRKATVYCENDILEIPYMTCRDVLKVLDSDQFVRCSRRVIINRKFVEEIDYGNFYIKLKHVGKPIEIGAVIARRFRDEMGC